MGIVVLLCAWAVALSLTSAPAQAKLNPKYYDKTCPGVFKIVADQMLKEILNDSRLPASMLRMHFHDCFVQGCDASVLLDGPSEQPLCNTQPPQVDAPQCTEKTTPPNNDSLRRFDVIDTTKALLEKACPNVVSCADTLALASFFGIIFSGGPFWAIPLGRRDSFGPNSIEANLLPPPFANITRLLELFARKNHTADDLVALSGAHTIGDVRCFILNPNSPFQSVNANLNPKRAAAIRALCQNGSPNAFGNTEGMDLGSSRAFDNSYFKLFATKKELFTSDSSLLNTSTTRKLVQKFANDEKAFFKAFAKSMIKMGDLNATAAPKLEVRKNCHVVNRRSNLLMPGEVARDEMPTEDLRELTEEETEEFIERIKEVVAEVKDENFARIFGERPLMTDSSYFSA